MKKSSKKNKSIGFEKSSGNVFADLEIYNSEEYLAKAELARQINRLIKQRPLNQEEAADLLGIDQPKVSRLSRGLLSSFSVGRLFKFLVALNQDIEIVVKPHRDNRMSDSHFNVRYADF